MRLGMMQPYFFPYMGYFALIAATDEWVVFDTPQYIRRGWVNRNRVLSTGHNDWKYVGVSVARAKRSAGINEIRIASPANLSSEVIPRLDEYRCWRAPFYTDTVQLISRCLADAPDSLNQLLVHCLTLTCEYLSISFSPQLFSRLPIQIPATMASGDWAHITAQHLQAGTYINPPGGQQLFDSASYAADGIRLQILEHRLPEYRQSDTPFVPGLSIIDSLMWNGPGLTRDLIEEYHLIDIQAAAEPRRKTA